jgi:putative membrane protein
MHQTKISLTIQLVLVAVVLAIGLPSLAQTTGSPAMPAENRDAGFVQQAGEGGLAEVELSQLALVSSASPAVKNFAQQMVDAHTANNKELTLVAAKENLRAPTGMDAEHVRLKVQLATTHGADFDHGYNDVMRSDHEKMVTLLEQTQGNATTQDIKTFAQKTLPVVKHHLQMADALAGN